ncbi:Tetratricopeptide repeat-domain-containing protein, partial [Kalaharituber pfeilii]
LGEDHPDTLRMVNNMAEVFYQQGQYDKALGLFEQALTGREKVLGADHLDTLRTVNNMAGIFYHQGQYDRALELFERPLAGRER